MRKRNKLLIASGVYLLGFGTLCGVVVERVRFDRQRTEVLARYDQALREWNTYRMAEEKALAAADLAAMGSRP